MVDLAFGDYMCGIVGFISDAENAIHNVMHGLKVLEYRGYDSAGIAYSHSQKINVLKSKGEVSNLFSKIKDITSKVAIGHTRWATHGEPNETNAHPQFAGDIVLVHNGIIENYKQLSGEFNLVSDTDTEVVAHLIAQQDGNDLLERVQAVLPKLEGSYALAVMSHIEPNRIVLACNQSPLAIGDCKRGAAIASDIYALVGHANKAYIMGDRETALVESGSARIFDRYGDPAAKTTVDIMRGVIDKIDLSEHKTYMHKEICEQPDAIRECIETNASKISRLIFDYDLHNRKVIFTACGTSYHACLVAQHFFEERGLNCDVRVASELRYGNIKIRKDDVLVAVSQSGETADTLAAVRMARESGATVVSVVNRSESAMARESNVSICTMAGPEISVASTKSFTTQIACMLMLRGSLITEELASLIEETLEQEQQILQVAKEVYRAHSMFFLGRGLGVPVAQEGALKLKEISYIHAEAYPAGELKHGPIALLNEKMPCVFIADKYSKTYDKVLSNLEEARARGAITIVVINENDTRAEDLADFKIYIPDEESVWTPFTASVALQLFAYHIAQLRGHNIDKPRNLAKSVTVE